MENTGIVKDGTICMGTGWKSMFFQTTSSSEEKVIISIAGYI